MALTADQLNTIYNNVLFRNVDAGGIQYFANRSDISDAQVRQQIELSSEASSFVSPIVRLYQEVLGRVPDQGGLKFFQAQLRAGTSLDNIAQQLINSTEFSAKTTSTSGVVDATDLSNTNQLVSDAFQSILGRTPGSSEFAFFQGKSAAQILSAVAGSAEATQSNVAGVVTFLDSVAQGSYPTGSLSSQTGGANGGTNAGQTFAFTTGNDALVGTAGNDTFRADNTTLQVTDSLRGNGGTDTLSYTDSSTTGVAPAAASVSGITNINIRNLSASGAVAATNGTNETDTVTFGALTANQTVTLNGRTITAGANGATASEVQQAYITGTANVDATPSGAFDSASYTVQTGPNANSAVLTATTTGNKPDLTLSGTGAGSSTLAIQQGTDGTAGSAGTQNQDTVAAGNFSGAVNFNSDNSTSAVAFTGLTAGQTVGIIGNGNTVNGAVSGTYADSVTSAQLNISGGTKGGSISIVGNGLTSETIQSTGAANVVAGVSNAATIKAVTINAATNLDLGTGINQFATGGTLTVSGAASLVKLGSTALAANLKSVDASGLTAGGVTATLNTSAPTGFTFTGGAGNDTVTVTGAFTNAPTNGAISGGAGASDVVNITTQTLSSTTGAAFSNFEILRNSFAGTQDATVVSGITSVQTNANGAGFSNLSATQAASVGILSSTAGSTFALQNSSGTSDLLSVTLVNDTTVNTSATAATVINARNLTVDGFETLNVVASSGSTSVTGTAGTNFDQVSFASAADLKSVVVSGAYAVDIVANANAVKITSIDASANTAGVTIETGGQTGALSITGSAGADTVTVGTVGANGSIGTINLGAGNDTLKIAQTSISTASILNGGSGTNTLEFTDTGAVIVLDASFQNATNFQKIVFDTTTSLTFNVGGYANSLATANGGVLDVTASALTGGSTINASGLSGSNKLSLNLTDTGNVTDTITTSTGGADSITIKGAHGTGAVVINGGTNTAGVTIDTSAVTTATGNNSITTGSGNDTIKVGTFTTSITSGTGTDTITLTTGDNFVQTINANTTGVSSTTNAATVNGFNVTANNDVLHFQTTTVLNSAGLANGFTVTNGVATKSGAALSDFVAAVASSTAAGAVAFQVGSDTYVAYSDGSSATTGQDHLVKLVGVTGVTNLDTTTAANHIVLA